MSIKKVSYNENSAKNLEQLAAGAFLTTKADGKVNTMTIGWGAIGFQWGKPVLTVMVRASRHTYDLIEKAGEFTVTIPYEDMKKELGICGSKSGRDSDKIKECGFNLIDGKNIATPSLDIKGMSFECKTVYKSEMTASKLDKDYNEKWYKDGDYHTIYYGEILESFVIE